MKTKTDNETDGGRAAAEARASSFAYIRLRDARAASVADRDGVARRIDSTYYSNGRLSRLKRAAVRAEQLFAAKEERNVARACASCCASTRTSIRRGIDDDAKSHANVVLQKCLSRESSSRTESRIFRSLRVFRDSACRSVVVAWASKRERSRASASEGPGVVPRIARTLGARPPFVPSRLGTPRRERSVHVAARSAGGGARGRHERGAP